MHPVSGDGNNRKNKVGLSSVSRGLGRSGITMVTHGIALINRIVDIVVIMTHHDSFVKTKDGDDI